MASIAEVATGLASTISTATGLRCFDYIPEDVNPPACVVTIDSIEPGAFKLGQMDMVFQATVLTARASDRAGQKALFEYMDSGDDNPKSVWRAIYDTPSLGLSNTNCGLRQMRSLTVEEIAAYGYYGVLFEILVLTSGA